MDSRVQRSYCPFPLFFTFFLIRQADKIINADRSIKIRQADGNGRWDLQKPPLIALIGPRAAADGFRQCARSEAPLLPQRAETVLREEQKRFRADVVHQIREEQVSGCNAQELREPDEGFCAQAGGNFAGFEAVKGFGGDFHDLGELGFGEVKGGAEGFDICAEGFKFLIVVHCFILHLTHFIGVQADYTHLMSIVNTYFMSIVR